MVAAALRHRVTRDESGHREYTELHGLLSHFDIELDPVWLASAANAQADALSRLDDRDEFGLAPSVLRRALNHLEVPRITLDAFASAAMCAAPRYYAKHSDPLAEGRDGFVAINTAAGETMLVFPPPPLWPTLLTPVRRAVRRGNVLVAVAPSAPSAPWFSALQDMATASFTVPRRTGALVHLSISDEYRLWQRIRAFTVLRLECRQ